MPSILGQQVADTLFNPEIKVKAYPNNDGTAIHIDRGHRNFHTRDGRFSPFARLLRQDGYRVFDRNGPFSETPLKVVKILVISNALPQNARQPFVSPTESAFTDKEIEVVKNWVAQGGSLFLIADHMPFAGASAKLAKAFGFEFYDSFVFDAQGQGIFDFSTDNGLLSSSPITKGSSLEEKIERIRTFSGQGFKIPNEANSILNLTDQHQVLLPDTMWVFNDNTKNFPATNLSQGAYMKYGKGRVMVFGEAAMFTGQLAGPNRIKVGMNSSEAPENYKLLLNIIHWLDRKY